MPTARPSPAFIVLACLLGSAAFGQSAVVPPRLTLQGRVVQPDGTPETAATQAITFRVYRADSGGTALFTESFPNVPLESGYFSVVLGNTIATPLPATLFDGNPIFVAVHVGGPSVAELAPRIAVTSVPYALRANVATDAEALNGKLDTEFAAAVHSHALAGGGQPGFVQDSERAKPNALPPFRSFTGNFNQSDAGVVSINFGTSSGEVAAGNHGHGAADGGGAGASGFISVGSQRKLDGLAAITNVGNGLDLSGGTLTLDPAGHTHPVSDAGVSGFISGADQRKLNGLAGITSVGAGLDLTGGALTADVGADAGQVAAGNHGHFVSDGGNEGFVARTDVQKIRRVLDVTAANTGVKVTGSALQADFGTGNAQVARGDHTHPGPTCTARSATATGPAYATAACPATETLMGGGCDGILLGTGAAATFKPVGMTTGSSGAGTQLYLCGADGGTSPYTAWAICCEF